MKRAWVIATVAICSAAVPSSGSAAEPAPHPTVLRDRVARMVCRSPVSDYTRAQCAYRSRNFSEAQTLFSGIAAKNLPDPVTIRSIYFAARSEMMLKDWKRAAGRLMQIYEMDPIFYDSWNCDILLGECRRAMGKG